MDPRLQEFLSLLGYLYLQNGKATKAIIVLEGLRVLSPLNETSNGATAYAHELAGNHAEALHRIQSLSVAERSTVAMRLVESRAYWGLGRKQEASDLANEALIQNEGVR
ncbi:MAG: hypothetical protein AAFX06_09215 [Planctomycetota bacterium]